MEAIEHQEEWNRALKDLEAESMKLKSYDSAILASLGAVQGRRILDYGAGPGILASALKRLGADCKAFDISEEMRKASAEKIGPKNVYDSVASITESFDIIICNLVLCIVDEKEVMQIAKNIRSLLKPQGIAYIGFCNPKIFDVPESQLDIRVQTGKKYEENHAYKKVKKEGGYEIIESHRPIEWYEKIYKQAGLKLEKTLFTPEYLFKGRRVQDFVIFVLSKEGSA